MLLRVPEATSSPGLPGIVTKPGLVNGLQLNASLLLIEKLQRHCAVRSGAAGAQRRGQESRLDQLGARSAGSFGCLRVCFDAVWALSGTGHSDSNQLAVFLRNGAVLAADN